MKRSDRLRPLLQHFVENGPAGCALAITHQGERVFEDYVGLADIDSGRKIAEDTIYRIYSMTKVVTCTAALMLYERGLYLLNDPLEDYLPEFKDPQVYRTTKEGKLYITPAARSIKVKDLFTMTSGLTYNGDGDETERQVQKAMNAIYAKEDGETALTVRDVSKALASIPLAFDPGSQWRYSLSHDVLGAFIEVLSGKSFGQFLQENIFAPLQMNDTFFRLPPEKEERLCSLYNRSETGELAKNAGLRTPFESGGAGLLSTIGDYSRFAHMLANGGELDGERILGRKTVDLMAANHLNQEQLAGYTWPYLSGYGYGLGVRTLMDPAAAGSNSNIGEFGWSGLAGTWVLIDPKERLSAVYMQQMIPNFEAYHQPRLRNVIYGTI
ncbi:CubicO group peptidase, beta-lactamase class C family [Evansella caseinilytica]|uniref:CubicO group peptidase, beta-lactamase class C family n=1 Tax=Evansella caseinilytica TaxID=1503961 RepID=A0A1H3ICU3_9BACI|nr:serine hydrolase domain-containing protein [Evansella caseinilytica]SDY25673.1 CubicO group peptidase, beta-lactamase class C family [Evansella caseinilytica]